MFAVHETCVTYHRNAYSTRWCDATNRISTKSNRVSISIELLELELSANGATASAREPLSTTCPFCVVLLPREGMYVPSI